jgi:uncharacterized protein YegL
MLTKIGSALKNFQFYGLLLALGLILGGCSGDGSSSTTTGPQPPSPTDPSQPQPPPVIPPPGVTVRITGIDATACPDVAVYASVTDETNATVLGLTEQNLQLFEDGDEQIIDVSYEDIITESIVFSLVMDYSLSLTDEDLVKVEEAAISFITELSNLTSSNKLSNWGEIIKFVRNIEVMQDFTTVKEDLLEGIKTQPQERGLTGTSLYDAIGNSIPKLIDFRNSAPADIPERSIMIVITDGLDLDSTTYDIDRIIADARGGGIEIITIGIGSEIDAQGLFDMADGTGGLYFFAPTTDDLLTIFTQFLDNLKNQYILRYNTSDPGTVNMVEVRVNTTDGNDSDSLAFACP